MDKSFGFNLDNAIALWRRSLENNRAFLKEDVVELERHIRDQVQALLARGMSEEVAFETALREMGDYTSTETEFRKVYWRKIRSHRLLRSELWLSTAMLKNYFIVTLRSFKRQPVYGLINITGLAIGLAGCMLIARFIWNEWQHDRFLEDREQIFRVLTHAYSTTEKDDGTGNAVVGWPQGLVLRNEVPEIEHVTYVRSGEPFFKLNGENVSEKVLYADSSFMHIFRFAFEQGDYRTALSAPYQIVLTPELAARYFPGENAYGRQLVMDDTLILTVSGILEPLLGPSHLDFGALVSFESFCSMRPGYCEQELENGWFDLNGVNYVRLKPGAGEAVVEAKIRDIPTQKAQAVLEELGYHQYLSLQPVSDIYLHAKEGNRLGPVGSARYVYLLGLIAVFLITIACINFVNLVTARALERAREVGIRKVVGSTRLVLVRQFLIESSFMAIFAYLIASGIAWLLVPYFNGLTGRVLLRSELFHPATMGITLMLVLAVGVLAGLYPALVLSRFKPIDSLKGFWSGSPRGFRLRQSLVVLQFSLSSLLITCTLVVLMQVRYMQTRDLGFEGEHVILIDAGTTPWGSRHQQAESIHRRFSELQGVEAVSMFGAPPGKWAWAGQICYPEGRPREEGISVEYNPVDAHYLFTFGLKLVAGRDFSMDRDRPSGDSPTLYHPLIVNETAVRHLGWGNPSNAIGKTIDSPSGWPRGTVIGVVADYHQRGLQERIPPVVLALNHSINYFALRLRPGDAGPAIKGAEERWKQAFPGYTFSYSFLNDSFNQVYESERRLTRVFSTFAFLSIFVACLGLFGLAAYSTQKRTKEIGVRKVLGASVAGLILLFSRSFLSLVLVAVFLSIPVAYLFLDRWLAGYAYHMTLNPFLFVVSGMLALIIALLTVSYQSLRAATTDPVKSLRYE